LWSILRKLSYKVIEVYKVKAEIIEECTKALNELTEALTNIVKAAITLA